MLDCFLNYIGLKGCGANDVTPPSGLFINSLEGISEELLTSIADSEQITAQDVWDDAQSNALCVFEGDILGILNERFSQQTILETVTVGQLCEPLVTVANSNELKGIALSLEHNKYFNLDIFQVYLYSDTAVLGAIINIYDLVTGKVVFTVTQDLVEGHNTINIEQSYAALPTRNRLFISYDANIVTSVKSQNTLWNDGCDCSGYVQICGGTVDVGTPVLWENLTRDGESHGMSVSFSLQCSLEKYICSKRSLFTAALKYLLGREIIAQAMASPRFNQFTTVSTKMHQDLHDEFERKYHDQLKTVLDNIRLPDDICFECDSEHVTTYINPVGIMFINADNSLSCIYVIYKCRLCL